jgi:hypothetical protein
MQEIDSIHIINTIFTGRGTRRDVSGIKEESDEWIARRIDLFKRYTLKSLLNQTNKNFLHWICFRTHNPQFDELGQYLKNLNYNFVFTFNGQCHWDDKAPNNLLPLKIENSMMILKPYLEGKKWVYYTHLDGDDMFTEDAIDLIQKEEPQEGRSLIFQKGYAVNYETKEVADWFCESPPFYTIIYPKDTFIDPKKKMMYELGLHSHEDALTFFDSKIMPENKYSYLIHTINKSTNWDHDFRGKIYTDVMERKEILRKLGQ